MSKKATKKSRCSHVMIQCQAAQIIFQNGAISDTNGSDVLISMH
jgi:hypothetical protein